MIVRVEVWKSRDGLDLRVEFSGPVSPEEARREIEAAGMKFVPRSLNSVLGLNEPDTCYCALPTESQIRLPKEAYTASFCFPQVDYDGEQEWQEWDGDTWVDLPVERY